MPLTTDQLDALTELINIGVGQAAGLLSEMIESRIQLQIPHIELLSPLALQNKLKESLGTNPLSAVKLGFHGSFVGSAQLIFPTESAATLVSVLTGETIDSPDLDDLKISTLSEVGNIVINGVMGSIGNVLNQPLDYDVPSYAEEEIEEMLPINQSDEDGTVLLVQARFTIEELLVQGDIVLFFELGSFQALLDAIEAVV
ncbi:MAG TPA: chemotaxis protein CheC [Cyanobacteria bacterium UBA11149]|nr:chemotaxis protein CheC [Cyanobacteria bacterium UBA11367]HBE57326.1 chemotaxis protein CheC [Cyanobacteria bacterium UBA11366]HBK64431.1 chemotaxis protein CheC [Cyanobacteria bacterium UBA11166]HBR72321.1 chemotaxis protein CheC [Cyanobacteria bacterium UBA11159]HBS71690.1 chemotaxis protein CheC [Cyanobacteria bacterium UBA11153]HBW89367.1 chemotaxis protein CheC [Cyanobacteria bacterium UBA11149]HCA97647.1 chemotaxis protein CheC [Cyanobacteria bacterium UBA9226]